MAHVTRETKDIHAAINVLSFQIKLKQENLNGPARTSQLGLKKKQKAKQQAGALRFLQCAQTQRHHE